MRGRVQCRERESILEHNRLQVSERQDAMQGEERESMLEHNRVQQILRRQCRENQIALLQQQCVLCKLAFFHHKIVESVL